MKKIGRYVFQEAGIPDVEQIFPISADYDAYQRAVSAGYALLAGKWVEPKPGENDMVWIETLERMASEYELLPDADQNQEGLRQLYAHIQIRKNRQSQPQAPGATQPGPTQSNAELQGGVPPAKTPMGLPGELAANPMEAQEGAMANV